MPTAKEIAGLSNTMRELTWVNSPTPRLEPSKRKAMPAMITRLTNAAKREVGRAGAPSQMAKAAAIGRKMTISSGLMSILDQVPSLGSTNTAR